MITWKAKVLWSQWIQWTLWSRSCQMTSEGDGQSNKPLCGLVNVTKNKSRVWALTVGELKNFLCLYFLTGIIKKNKARDVLV